MSEDKDLWAELTRLYSKTVKPGNTNKFANDHVQIPKSQHEINKLKLAMSKIGADR